MNLSWPTQIGLEDNEVFLPSLTSSEREGQGEKKGVRERKTDKDALGTATGAPTMG